MAFKIPEGATHRSVLIVETSTGICKTDLLKNDWGTLTLTLPVSTIENIIQDYIDGNEDAVIVRFANDTEYDRCL